MIHSRQQSLSVEIRPRSSNCRWPADLIVAQHGGLSLDGERWVGLKKLSFLFAVKVISRRFRTLVCNAIREAWASGELALPADLIADGTALDLLLALSCKSDWHSYVKPPFGGPEQVLAYLAAYTHRIAISNRRILAFDGNEVTFSYRDHAQGNSQKTMTLEADELLRRSIHPADNVARKNLLDVEKRWSYTVFLSALARYLDLKAELGELDRMYAYAQASLLAYARWMVENERPYLDRADELEFPTETWPAQGLRRSNVLWLAARHADEPLRSALAARAGDLAERAWNDLMQFESRAVARAVAIVMVEGLRDHYFRTEPLDATPRPAEDYDFGAPQVFVPQRQRIRDQCRTPLGLARMLGRLFDPQNWRALFLSRRSSTCQARANLLRD